MPPAPKTSAGRSIFSLFAVQAGLTALFGLVNSESAHGPAVRALAIAAAVLCLGVGLILYSWPSPATWMLAVGFEIAFIVVGVAVFAGWHVYMVGTIVAIANVARLSRARAAFAGSQAAIPGYGQHSSAPPGYGQPYMPQGNGQPGAAQGYATVPPGQPPDPGQQRYPSAAQSPPPEEPDAQHLRMTCAKCGQQLAEGSRSCVLCGAPVT
jgi:hypothetical protein